MKNYKIFKSSSGIYEAVKQGWSWPAFFFNFFWAVTKQLWGVAAIIFFIALISTMYFLPNTQGMTDDQIMAAINHIGFLIETPIRIILAVFGNKLREQNLRKRGYELIAYISAESPAKAVAQYLKGNNSFLEM